MALDAPDFFQHRHIGPRPTDLEPMLEVVGASSLETIIDEAVPAGIRLETPLDLPEPETEACFLQRLQEIAARNQLWRSFIGLGYYGSITPSVILRNVFENPGWYTPYTPYQAEVAQGRLEALLNFQTMVKDLTGMQVANASLLDEATAAAEAMAMLHRLQVRHSRGAEANRFMVAATCFPQTIEVVKGRAEPLGIEVVVTNTDEMVRDVDDGTFGLLVQYPDVSGRITDLSPIITRAHEVGAFVAVASDLLALTLLADPGEAGADVVVGSAQRFGIPLGYGGPHAAFFATREAYVRQMPGRLIGVSVDTHGRPAYRMALQTREQHIRRERATSNICTAQALLANMAGMYAAYHGPHGLIRIARRVYGLAHTLARALADLGFTQRHAYFFDTLCVAVDGAAVRTRLRKTAERERLNFWYHSDGDVGIALDETTTVEDVTSITRVFAEAADRPAVAISNQDLQVPVVPDAVRRTTPFLAHPVFNSYHSELQMMRYLKQLERKDLGLDTSMIPLGSCTMKLNAATQMRPVSWAAFAELHPFVPVKQAAGYHQIFLELEASLCAISGFQAVSLQPNSGAQGEFAGLLVIRAYHRARSEAHRDVVLIPASAHGTNPASAAMAGMQVVVVACDDEGNVDLRDLQAKAGKHRDRLSALMITYPSTHGVFEEPIEAICRIVHDHGGQVYMDGANMNAQVGITSPARIGADVCHINLHKTFSIPHGGGGPGMGPIAVAAHLATYLPGHPLIETGGGKPIRAVAAAPWGSASVLLISYAYIRLLGRSGVTEATKVAILSANYIKSKLEEHYDVLYARSNGRVAHELIFDLRAFKAAAGISEQDIAKRLMDYGFHAPTVSFPVPGTLMVEPTESEPREELDRFCEAMIEIRREIQAVVDGHADPTDNVIKNAPHTAMELAVDEWGHPYSRAEAVFPLPFVRANKYWPPVSAIDAAYGDRHLMCACPPVDAYDETLLSRE